MSSIVVAPLHAQSFPVSGGYSNPPLFIVRAYPVDEAGRRSMQLPNHVFTGGNTSRTMANGVRFVDSGTLWAIGDATAVVRAIRKAILAAGYESVEFQSARHGLVIDSDRVHVLAA